MGRKIKELLKSLAIKHLNLMEKPAQDSAKAESSKFTIDPVVQEIANAQLEAENCIQAMNAMVTYYEKRDGVVEADYLPAAVKLMTAAQTSVRKISNAVDAAYRIGGK